MTALQWGGRFALPPDPRLLAYGSSLEDDLVLAPFDVRCSHAHVTAQLGGAVIDRATAEALYAALDTVAREIASLQFADFARSGDFEDVHGAIDARVRALAPAQAGEALHAGRSRNDQVATTLLLYARDRAGCGVDLSMAIARRFLDLAETAHAEGTMLAATTHWQPAQPVLLSFWLHAAAEGFLRSAQRFARVVDDATAYCPLGSGAVAGSSLALDRAAAARELGFREPTRNALDTVGDRDAGIDLLDAAVRAAVTASRPSEEFVIWTTPAFGYAKLDDAASTGSSLMPQKRNPDPFELVRGAAGRAIGDLSGALSTLKGIGLSYHRDLQETKAAILQGTERALAALDAFALALNHLSFDGARMTEVATRGFTVATDVADSLIQSGQTARAAHRLVGETIAQASGETFTAADLARLRARSGSPELQAPLDAVASVGAKKTSGSTEPSMVAAAIATTRKELDRIEEKKK